MSETIVIALGGNAIKQAKETGTYEEQLENVSQTTEQIAKLIEEGANVIITHGNGPQVGDLLVQHDCAKASVPPLPMFMCGAQSQGSIGLLIQQTLKNHLRQLGIKREVGSLVTQVLVSPNDPAFDNPTKPVGPFYKTKEEIQADIDKGYEFKEDKARGGFRRVVPSPKPLTIVELALARDLIAGGHIVVASGGGGIPVYEKKGRLYGLDAVIDKDAAGQLLASELEADQFVILTDVGQVALNFNTPKQRELEEITLAEAEKYLSEGHFAEGSMKPKVESAIAFLKEGGQQVIITDARTLLQAIQGKGGTRIKP